MHPQIQPKNLFPTTPPTTPRPANPPSVKEEYKKAKKNKP